VHPAREAGARPRIVQAQGAASMRPVGVHRPIFRSAIPREGGKAHGTAALSSGRVGRVPRRDWACRRRTAAFHAAGTPNPRLAPDLGV
jgi:hypothetical protein